MSKSKHVSKAEAVIAEADKAENYDVAFARLIRAAHSMLNGWERDMRRAGEAGNPITAYDINDAKNALRTLAQLRPCIMV